MKMIYAIHEADGQDVTMMLETAYALSGGGGKPGQGYPCIFEDDDDVSEGDRLINGEQPSGELLRTGCIQ